MSAKPRLESGVNELEEDVNPDALDLPEIGILRAASATLETMG